METMSLGSTWTTSLVVCQRKHKAVTSPRMKVFYRLPQRMKGYPLNQRSDHRVLFLSSHPVGNLYIESRHTGLKKCQLLRRRFL